MSKRKIHLIGDFLAKQDITIMFPCRFGDPTSGYRQVFTCAAEFDFDAHDPDAKLLDQLFEMFNIGTESDPVVRAYREAGNRSLSAGDVVVLDQEVAWLCQSVGWEPFNLKAADGSWVH